MVKQRPRKKEKSYICYILKSLHPKYLNKTYVGITHNFKKRLRQHNGEIVGGANKTKRARPWQRIAFVEGFPTKVDALHFEWRMQHQKVGGGVSMRSLMGRIGPDGIIKVLRRVMKLPRATKKAKRIKDMPLKVKIKKKFF